MPRRSATAVARSRSDTVSVAADLASIDGLEGLTIGRLADRLGMSKSGLIGRFGDKEALQRAVLAAAVERFRATVYEPALALPAGRERLKELIDRWIAHLRERVFPGGCFVTTASVEYDARPGALHDEIAAVVQRWLGALEAEVRAGQEAGELPADREPADVAFELHSLASGGGVAARLLDDSRAFERMRTAMRRTAGLD